ncbi:MAG: gamma-glutamyl-gamma-aminobutyrate hydrolase family protein [Chloroflexi bacterium]|nr:gamma-glutamyl-gamma-aminobutyrate hydrolase family protein [Chloroflexota bacterium]
MDRGKRATALMLPVVIVTASTEAAALAYQRVVERRGAQVRLALPDAPGRARDALDGASGLLLSGGEDVDPALYGAAPNPGAGVEVNRARDELERSLLAAALERDLPVLAICRGMQFLNVFMGGKLIQDLPHHKVVGQDGGWGSAYHQVYLAPGSKLAAILGAGGFLRVNSRHHQGLRDAQKAPPLLATAYSVQDGLVEALESPAHDWVIGVQCHPEREEEVPRAFGRLFEAFVERAGRALRRHQGVGRP